MKKVLLALLGLILLAILGFFCFQNKADTIRETLVSSANTALVANNIQGVTADLNGNDFEMTDIIKLTGEVPSLEEKAKAEQIANAIEGIGGVDNQLTIAAKAVQEVDPSPAASQEAVPAPAAVQKASIDPYTLTLTKDETGHLSLEGYVEDEGNKTLLLTHANELFGSENVTETLKVAAGAPEDWEYISVFALDRLKDVDYGDMNLTNHSYEFTGHLPTPSSKAGFLDSIRTVMSNPENKYGRFRGDYIITAPVEEPVVASKTEPEPKKAPAIKKELVQQAKIPAPTNAAECQTEIDKVLGGNKVLFDTNKAVIKHNSFALLDDLATTIQACPITTLEIAGHTDSDGSTAYNKRLSTRRAKSVKDYFVKKGLPSTMIEAKGYGETHPISSNKNAAGRAKNRRIEFIVKGMK